MQKNGEATAKTNPDYKGWSVSVDDVFQWIGCWLYMLAFPIPGPRSQYFKSPSFGPFHPSLKAESVSLWCSKRFEFDKYFVMHFRAHAVLFSSSGQGVRV